MSAWIGFGSHEERVEERGVLRRWYRRCKSEGEAVRLGWLEKRRRSQSGSGKGGGIWWRYEKLGE